MHFLIPQKEKKKRKKNQFGTKRSISEARCHIGFFIFVRYFFNADYIEKFKKYEADYTCRLMAKYFSKKNLYGGKQNCYNLCVALNILKKLFYFCFDISFVL
jgi:hypothetical protein